MKLFENKLIHSALNQSSQSHSSQERTGGGNNLEYHILPVTKDLIEYYVRNNMKISPWTISATLLHDTWEDDKRFQDRYGKEEFEMMFGRRVYEKVAILTKPDYKIFKGKDKAEKKQNRDREYFAHIQEASLDIRLIKLSDRLNNIMGAHMMDEARMRKYVSETQEHFLTLAEKTFKAYHDAISSRVKKVLRLYLNKFDVIETVFSKYSVCDSGITKRAIAKSLLEDEAIDLVVQMTAQKGGTPRKIYHSRLEDTSDGWYPKQLIETFVRTDSYKYDYRPSDTRIKENEVVTYFGNKWW